MGDPAVTPGERFTYRQYRTWPDSERWELLEGHAWAMSPAPTTRHQRLLLKLAGRLQAFLEGKPCEVFIAPFDVLLPAGREEDDEVDSLVQPDLSVFCDPDKLRESGARGAPDLVIEILSPSTARKDQGEKFDLYARRGVREYWVVDPAGGWLCVYRPAIEASGKGRFDGGELREPLRDFGPVASTVLAGFVVDPGWLFAK